MHLKQFSLCLLASTCLLSLGSVARLSAQAPTWDKASAKADAVVLLDSTHVRVTDNGSGTFIIRKTIKMLTPKGALQHRTVVYDYDPLTAFARFEAIRILHPDGSVTELDPSKACDYAAPARAIYWGARQIMAEPGRLEPGDILDYTIEKKGFTYALLMSTPSDEDRFIPPMRGNFYDIIPFWVEFPTEKKMYLVDVPKDKELQFKFYQGTCQTAVTFLGDRTLYAFTTLQSVPPQREPSGLDFFDTAPKLMLSSTPDWEAKSLWFNKVNEDYGSFEATPEAQAKVDALLKGVTDETQRIAILTHWVADNMRYSGISMGKGEGYTLHNTRMNFTDRCGVCKDKAALLISMLRMAGFQAYPAMTMAGSRIESIPADHFNHCVVVVKRSDGSYMPLDPTWVPFIRELWSSAEQQQNYLPGIPEGSDLCLTPPSDPDNHYLRITAKTALSADGTLTGECTVSAEGQTDNGIRRPFTTGLEDNVYNAIESELLRISPNAQLISYDAGKDPKDYQKAPISLTLKFRIPEYAVVGENTLVCEPLVFSNLYANNRVFARLNPTQETRKNGFQIRCSQRMVLDETLTLPKGFTLQTEAKETVLPANNVATFEGTRTHNANTLTIHQNMALYKRIYQADEWPVVRDVIRAYNAFAEEPIVLIKK